MTQNSCETEVGLLISVVFGDEPAFPGLSKGNPVQLKSGLKAKEFILQLPGNLGQGQVNVFQAMGRSGQGSCRPNLTQCNGFVDWDYHSEFHPLINC